jgi:hypothetical protein
MERVAFMRTVLGVIVGYVFFGAASVMLFILSRHQPHDPATVPFMFVATIYGMVAALVGGLIATAISGRPDGRAGAIVAVVIAIGAVMSMFTVPEGGQRWSMVAAIVLMAPMAWLGGKSLTILKRQLSNLKRESPGGRA